MQIIRAMLKKVGFVLRLMMKKPRLREAKEPA